ncbi:MAG: hypothetical protein VX964_04890, partial [Verrucomicrobiota bacterium]|nr:hypothetical protein [Verrucomicrobiota bacterium]
SNCQETKHYFLDQIFTLMYYMGFTYVEAYNIPIWQRIWFIERLNKELKAANEAQSGASRAAHANTPDQRALMGRHRQQVPSKLRRFT